MMKRAMMTVAVALLIVLGAMVLTGTIDAGPAGLGMLCLGGLVYVPMIDDKMPIQAEVTKTDSFDGAALDLGGGYAPGGLGQIKAAVATVSALDLSSGNETYSLKLQQSADGANNWTDIGPVVSVTAVGTYVVKGIVTTRYLRLVLTAGGTTPSITYLAYLGE